MFKLDWFKADRSHNNKMGCGSSYDASDGPRTVVVFGATGLLGGAIARRLLQEPFLYKVRCVTRRSSSDKARQLAEHGAVIVNGDLGETKSLEKALEGADIMFLTTHYWEERNKEKEVIKGLNAIDAAIQCGVKHIIFNGSENVKKIIGKECNHLDSKSAIEEYIREVDNPSVDVTGVNSPLPGINFTILRLPFWYENFYTVFKPHKLKHAVYTIALPLEGTEIDAMSVEDVGDVIVSILRKPKQYYGKTLNISVEKLSMEEIVDTFNRHFDNRKFTDSKTYQLSDYLHTWPSTGSFPPKSSWKTIVRSSVYIYQTTQRNNRTNHDRTSSASTPSFASVCGSLQAPSAKLGILNLPNREKENIVVEQAKEKKNDHYDSTCILFRYD